jgi:hypothetical protein
VRANETNRRFFSSELAGNPHSLSRTAPALFLGAISPRNFATGVMVTLIGNFYQ